MEEVNVRGDERGGGLRGGEQEDFKRSPVKQMKEESSRTEMGKKRSSLVKRVERRGGGLREGEGGLRGRQK